MYTDTPLQNKSKDQIKPCSGRRGLNVSQVAFYLASHDLVMDPHIPFCLKPINSLPNTKILVMTDRTENKCRQQTLLK